MSFFAFKYPWRIETRESVFTPWRVHHHAATLEEATRRYEFLRTGRAAHLNNGTAHGRLVRVRAN